MKKLLMLVCLIGLPTFALIGCGGGGENTIVEGEVEPAMTDSQMSEYEEQMRSGGAGSSAPGN